MHDIIKHNIKMNLANKILKLMAEEAKLGLCFLSSKARNESSSKLEAYQKILDLLKEF